MIKQNSILCLVYCVFILSLCNLGIASSKQQVTIYGDNGYPPYSYEENGEPKGVYVDILKIVFSRMNDYDVKIELKPWKRCIHFIKNGKVLAFFPPYYSDERTLWVNYSEPILQEQVVVFGKPDKLQGKTKWPEDFYDSKIGMNRGYDPTSMAGEKFAAAIKAGMIEFEEADNNEMNLKKLEAGRLDFYLSDKLINITKYSSIKRGVVAKNNYGYLGFTRKYEQHEYLSDFKKKFDQIIKQMKDSKEIEKIVENYIK